MRLLGSFMRSRRRLESWVVRVESGVGVALGVGVGVGVGGDARRGRARSSRLLRRVQKLWGSSGESPSGLVRPSLFFLSGARDL